MDKRKLKIAVLQAIKEVGLDTFKKTSMFASNQRSVIQEKKAA